MSRGSNRLRAFGGLLVTALAACVSVGDGKGSAKSDHLIAEDCWDGPFDLEPDFFAADPFRDSVHIRLQRGSDLLEVSDGVVILIDSMEEVRDRLGEEIPVTISPGVAPPGLTPGDLCQGDQCDSPIHAALYLLDSCHAQNTVLYAISGTVTFDELFSGDPNEADPAKRFNSGSFSLTVGDLRDVTIDEDGVASVPNTSDIEGTFEFFFQRGQPAQPFP